MQESRCICEVKVFAIIWKEQGKKKLNTSACPTKQSINNGNNEARKSAISPPYAWNFLLLLLYPEFFQVPQPLSCIQILSPQMSVERQDTQIYVQIAYQIPVFPHPIHPSCILPYLDHEHHVNYTKCLGKENLQETSNGLNDLWLHHYHKLHQRKSVLSMSYSRSLKMMAALTSQTIANSHSEPIWSKRVLIGFSVKISFGRQPFQFTPTMKVTSEPNRNLEHKNLPLAAKNKISSIHFYHKWTHLKYFIKKRHNITSLHKVIQPTS